MLIHHFSRNGSYCHRQFSHLFVYRYHIGHACHHMIKIVTVMKPPSGIICNELNLNLLHGINNHGILLNPVLFGYKRIDYFKKMPVQMHGMGHPAVIPVADPHPLALNALTVVVGFPKDSGAIHMGTKDAAEVVRAVFKNDRLVIFMPFLSIFYGSESGEKISFLFQERRPLRLNRKPPERDVASSQFGCNFISFQRLG
jgi:hypothetical protein